jgi:hypothetical protein
LTVAAPQKAEDLVDVGYARAGIYGENGAGKTTFLSTIPPDIQTLVLSANNENIKPLRGRPHIRIAKITRWDDLYDYYLSLKKGNHKYQCIAVDTETRMQALAGLKISGQEVKPGEEVKWLQSAPRLGKGYDYWDSVGSLCAEHVRLLCGLPMHVVLLFQEMTRTPKLENDLLETGPAVTPAALREIKTTLEILGRLYVETEEGEDGELMIDEGGEAAQLRRINFRTVEKRRLLLGKHPRYFAKGPTEQLGYCIENPTWASLAPSWS